MRNGRLGLGLWVKLWERPSSWEGLFCWWGKNGMNTRERKWKSKKSVLMLGWLFDHGDGSSRFLWDISICYKATLHHIPVDCRTSHLRFHNLHSPQNVIRMMKSNTTISFKRGTLLHGVSNLVQFRPFSKIFLLILCGYEAWFLTFREEHKPSFWEWGSEKNICT